MTQQPAWQDTTFPYFGNQKAAEIPEWADDPGWTERYTEYADLIRIASDARQAAAEDGVEGRPYLDLVEALGDPSRGIWLGFDFSERRPDDVGRLLIEEVIAPTLDGLILKVPENGGEFLPVFAWKILFAATSRMARKRLYVDLVGGAPPDDINKWLFENAWPYGLRESERAMPGRGPLPSLKPESAPGLRRLTTAFDVALKQALAIRESGFDLSDPFAELLPDDVARVLAERTERLRIYRNKLLADGQAVEGIDENGLTDLWRQGLPVLRQRIKLKQPMLLIGPTTTGKTDFSRIAAAHVIWNKRKVIVLLPTKALVTQAAEDWRKFFSQADSSKEWRLLEASRDHPYNDEDISRGDYDIVLAIPEKLAAYLASGSRMMEQCGLLVVDELQTLNERSRGGNIEALLTIIRARYPHVPTIGLSATLTASSSATVRKWLGVGDCPEDGLVVTTRRPVPLDRYATEPTEWMLKPQTGMERRDQWVPALLTPDMNDFLKGDSIPPESRITRSAHRDAIALACRLLQRPDAITDTKSIIIFVGSRQGAERVTKGLQAALDYINFGERGGWYNPHLGRFGRDTLTPAEAERRDAEFLELPNLPATEDVRDGLATGVMYHSARLDPEHRRIIEHAFQDRIIRVLVATATLAIGVNLPADFVIVADVTEGTGQYSSESKTIESLLDPHGIAQRFGRCGRLGMTSRGEAYVIVQRGHRSNRVLRLSEEQKAYFDREIQSLEEGRVDGLPLESAVEMRLAKLEPTYSYFISSEDGGEPVESNLDSRGFARLLLQDLCRDAAAVSEEEIERRVQRVYRVSLLVAEGKACPDSFDLIETLDSAKLIAPAPEDPARFKITGLGRTVALSNIPVSNARGIREVAEAALLGAGPLTLLTIAANSEYVRSLTWLGLPRSANTALIDEVRQKAWTLVRAFGSPDHFKDDTFEAPGFLEVISEEGKQGGLIGHGQAAQAVRGRLELEARRLPDTTIESHMRACIAYLWLRGVSMNQILSYVTENTRATLRQHSLSVDAYPADVRDLGERLSYVLNAAAEVLRISPTAHEEYLVVRNLSESLQSGIPYQLAPMLRMRSPRIHRERLATLLDLRDGDLDFDNIEGMLQLICVPRPDRTAQQKRAHSNLAFSQEEIVEIAREFSRVSGRIGSRALPPDLRFEKIPSRNDVEGAVTYGRIADDMSRKQGMDDRVEELSAVLAEFGFSVDLSTDSNDTPVLVIHREGYRSLRLVLIDLRLDRASLGRHLNTGDCLILFQEPRAGAIYALRNGEARELSVMTIWVFLAALARLARNWRLTYFGGDPEDELARRVVVFFGSLSGIITLADVSLAEVASGLPAPPPLFAN